MAIDERLRLGRKSILVGVRFNTRAKELLDWALEKVADPGDAVVAIHVCRNSDCVSKERVLLDSYLKDYQAPCNKKHVALIAEVLKGNSIRKVLVREAKNRVVSAILLGITKHSALAGRASIAKYCAKKLHPTTEVVAIHNGKVVFSRCSRLQLEVRENQSEFGESEISEMSHFSSDTTICSKNEEIKINPSREHVRRSLSLISLPVEDFTKERLGWPLLQTTSSITQPALQARKMSVVQWVMSLPPRSLSVVSEPNSPTIYEDSLERENVKLEKISTRGNSDSWQELSRDLELILIKNSADCEVFSRDVLKMSTSDFSSDNLIGKGGCNSVYKGILPEGKPVAIKILKSSKEARNDFSREVDIMTTLKHQRITPLIGICTEDNDLISVYDYLSKGNLEENLHSNQKESILLSWEARFQIANGIAEALNYLHNECKSPIIHRDIKSSNILLTDKLEPQLCDFGLAIWGPTTAYFMTDSDVVGTFGYLAPEYFMYGKVSDKIDVYGFGVVLLELLSGRKPIGLDTAKGQESLVMWAKPKLETGDLKSLLDPNLDGNIDETQMQRMAKAATLCLTQAARRRPKICQILSILSGEESVDEVKQQYGKHDGFENQDDDDDEVYPNLSAESHLSLAFLDVNNDSTSSCSFDQSSPLSVEEYLKQRWSRSSSLQ